MGSGTAFHAYFILSFLPNAHHQRRIRCMLLLNNTIHATAAPSHSSGLLRQCSSLGQGQARTTVAQPHRKKLLSAADDKWHNREHQLTHQVGSEERLHHSGAAVEVDVAARMRPQVGYRLEKVLAADDGGRVLGNVRLGERVGDDVLLHAVDLVCEGESGLARPCRSGDEVRATSLQKGVALLCHFVKRLADNLRVKILHHPSAVGKAAFGVFTGGARRLDDTVEADEFGDECFYDPN